MRGHCHILENLNMLSFDNYITFANTSFICKCFYGQALLFRPFINRAYGMPLSFSSGGKNCDIFVSFASFYSFVFVKSTMHTVSYSLSSIRSWIVLFRLDALFSLEFLVFCSLSSLSINVFCVNLMCFCLTTGRPRSELPFNRGGLINNRNECTQLSNGHRW